MRRALGLLGHSWAYAPVRRIVQAASLALFLALFLYVCWPYGARHYADAMAAKEYVQAEAFLALDPLASISTALAARAWVWSLTWAAVILAVCLLIPRGFCGYVCPLGTLIDLFDWAVGKRAGRLHLKRRGWWANVKYYLLPGVLLASVCGLLVSGFVSAIPVLTRGLAFTLGPLQLGLLRDWYLVPAFNVGHVVSLVLFAAVFAVGLLGRRFWCRCLCPSGAVFSVANLLRLTERKVTSDCIECGRCAEACPFDAIRDDYSTRPAECTFCQTCGGACPVSAITFAPRWSAVDAKERAGGDVSLSRRGFVAAAVVSPAVAFGTRRFWGAGLHARERYHPLRPPGSVPEADFLRLCVRCGECFKACPNNVLQPLGVEQGLEGIWTPKAVPDWSGCEASCTNCGQVCPTGAIRALPLEEKRVARMGLAIVNERTCLPHAQTEACQMCIDECNAAGYEAIEFRRVGTRVDEQGMPVGGSGYLAPVLLDHKCVGCGLCQTRCNAINVKQRHVLTESAIIVEAGPGKEDRMATGSYLALREQEAAQRESERRQRLEADGATDAYLPDFLQ